MQVARTWVIPQELVVSNEKAYWYIYLIKSMYQKLTKARLYIHDFFSLFVRNDLNNTETIFFLDGCLYEKLVYIENSN